jgi:hypothetical protein
VVRGRLLVTRQLARLPGRFDAHLLRTDDFLADTLMNRIIKAGIRWVAKITRVTATTAKCWEAVMRMEAVADLVGLPRAFAEAARRLGGVALDRWHAAADRAERRLCGHGLGHHAAAAEQQWPSGQRRVEPLRDELDRHGPAEPCHACRPARQRRRGLCRPVRERPPRGNVQCLVRRTGPGGEAGCVPQRPGRLHGEVPYYSLGHFKQQTATRGIQGLQTGFTQFCGIQPA